MWAPPGSARRSLQGEPTTGEHAKPHSTLAPAVSVAGSSLAPGSVPSASSNKAVAAADTPAQARRGLQRPWMRPAPFTPPVPEPPRTASKPPPHGTPTLCGSSALALMLFRESDVVQRDRWARGTRALVVEFSSCSLLPTCAARQSLLLPPLCTISLSCIKVALPRYMQGT